MIDCTVSSNPLGWYWRKLTHPWSFVVLVPGTNTVLLIFKGPSSKPAAKEKAKDPKPEEKPAASAEEGKLIYTGS